MVGDYAAFFKKTFKPRDGYVEDARYMGTTNSAGAPRVELIVDGISFGKLTAQDYPDK